MIVNIRGIIYNEKREVFIILVGEIARKRKIE